MKNFQLAVHIRWMIRRDMPEVLEIERAVFEYAWTEEDFVHCIRQRNCIGMVAELDEQIVGFMIYELHKSKLRVLNFAVAAEYHRNGIGSQMVAKLKSKLSHQRWSRLVLEVRETNLQAQFFFRALDFRATSVLRDFYEDLVEDAYLMQYCHPAPERRMPVNRIAKYATQDGTDA